MHNARHARIISVANRKGGTGKSTTVVNLGAELAARGYRILVVDIDSQGHAGLGFGILASTGTTVHDVFRDRHPRLDVGIRPTSEPNLDVLPADRDFDGLAAITDPRCLAKALRPLRSSYDMMLLDTPPATPPLIVCALMASEGVVVPTALEHLALDGVRQFSRTYHYVVTALNAALLGLAVLPSRVDLRNNVQKDVLGRLNRSFGLDQVLTGIRVDTSISEAFGCHRPVRRYRAKTRAVDDFACIADQVIRRFG